MANSMDDIKVLYKAVQFDNGYTTYQTKKLKDFIKLPATELSKTEQKIQKALKAIYRANGQQPPIYKEFKQWDPYKPLKINCTTVARNNCAAFFASDYNEIRFVDIDTEDDLINSIAHELKHAEQYSNTEIRQIVYKDTDNRKKQELFVLNEAEAFFTGVYVYLKAAELDPYIRPNAYASKDNDLKAYLDLLIKHNNKHSSNLKETMMANFISRVSKHDYRYKLQREMRYPVTQKDKGLDYIPEHYGLDNKFLKNILKPNIPQEAETNSGKIRQYLAMKRWDLVIKTLKDLDQPGSNAIGVVLSDFIDEIPVLEQKEYVRQLLFILKTNFSKSFLDKKVVIEALCCTVRKGEAAFKNALRFFHEQNFSFTADDFEDTYGNKLISSLPINSIQKLSFLSELVGDDGKPLIKPETIRKKTLKQGAALLNKKIVADTQKQPNTTFNSRRR